MANTLNTLRKMRAAHMTRTQNVGAALAYGVPTSAKEIAAVTGVAAIATTAVELLSPVPATALAVVAEAGLALAVACGLKSAYQGREFWKAAILGSDADELRAKSEDGDVYPPEGALDSNLKPTKNKVSPWTAPDEMTEEFRRRFGTDIIRG